MKTFVIVSLSYGRPRANWTAHVSHNVVNQLLSADLARKTSCKLDGSRCLHNVVNQLLSADLALLLQLEASVNVFNSAHELNTVGLD
jgi:hypothetical protein